MAVKEPDSVKISSLQEQLATALHRAPDAGVAEESDSSIAEQRKELYSLAGRVPESEIPTAKRLLQALIVDPLWLSLQTAPVDEEELSDSAIQSLRLGREELARGETVSHEEVLREFGL